MKSFRKIRVTDKVVELEWTTPDPSGEGETKHELTCKHEAHADLVAALQAFRPHVQQLLEVTKRWAQTVTVTSLSISKDKNGRRGLVVTGTRPVADASSPFVIHTPHLAESVQEADESDENDSPTLFSGKGVWLEGMAEALETAEQEATAYIDGKRAQGDLFEQPVEAHGAEAEEPEGEPVGVAD